MDQPLMDAAIRHQLLWERLRYFNEAVDLFSEKSLNSRMCFWT
jgi:hypothetical protein